MAVIVLTSDPKGLLKDVRTEITSGSIDTWTCDEDGDFTHSPAQWNRKAWFRPRVEDERLVFNIFPPRGARLTRVVYGVYHGRFIEMLLNHFDLKFRVARATALPSAKDSVGE